MPNGAVTSPNGEVTPQSDSFLGMLLELLKGRWTEREEQTGQSMGIQNVAALSALEFLKPPQKMVPTKNPKLLKMGLKEEMNPAYLEMIAMGTMGKPKGVGKLKTTKTKFSKGLEAEIDSYTDVISERWTAYGEKPYSKKEILQELMQDHMDNPQHPISKYKRELQDFGAKIGIWKSVSKTQLKEMVAPGKKYEFKRGDKYYVFDSWKPLMKKAQVSKPSAPKNLDERKEFFNKEIAQAQRGVPETKMVELQHVAGGGPISHVSESVGDLIDRIYGTPQKHGGRGWAWEATHEKINRSLATLEDAYGFKRWVSENATANAKAQGISIEQYKKGVDRALKEYADAHRNIPTYNKVQKLANDAAVAFGEKNFDLTIKNLKILRNYMDEGFESWEKRVYSLSRK